MKPLNKKLMLEEVITEAPLVGDVKDYSSAQIDQDIADLEAEKERRLNEPDSDELVDISDDLADAGVDWVTEDSVGHDIIYRKLLKSVREVEKFNFHSDYWGSADAYQEANVQAMEILEPYVGKKVKIDSDDGPIICELEGLLVDKQYNDIGHSAALVKEIEGANESVKEDLTDDEEDPVITPEPEAEDKKVDTKELSKSTMVSEMIKGEWDAIDLYNSMIGAFEEEGDDRAIKLINDIVKEEYVHVGELEHLLSLINENSNEIDAGVDEASELIGGTDDGRNN